MQRFNLIYYLANSNYNWFIFIVVRFVETIWMNLLLNINQNYWKYRIT